MVVFVGVRVPTALLCKGIYTEVCSSQMIDNDHHAQKNINTIMMRDERAENARKSEMLMVNWQEAFTNARDYFNCLIIGKSSDYIAHPSKNMCWLRIHHWRRSRQSKCGIGSFHLFIVRTPIPCSDCQLFRMSHICATAIDLCKYQSSIYNLAYIKSNPWMAIRWIWG